MKVNLLMLMRAYGLIPGQTITDAKGDTHQVKEDGTLDSGKNLFDVPLPFEESIKLSEFIKSDEILGIRCNDKKTYDKLVNRLKLKNVPEYTKSVVVTNRPASLLLNCTKVFDNIIFDKAPKTCNTTNCNECPAQHICKHSQNFYPNSRTTLEEAFMALTNDEEITQLLLRRLDK